MHVFVTQFPANVPGLPEAMSGAVALFTDDTGNTHSLYHPERFLTPDGYWDVMACIPGLVACSQEAPIAICGLGGGTAARVIHQYFPAARMIGWELDEAVLTAARRWMGMDQLEQNGCLDARQGNALEMEGVADGSCSAILVDLFSMNDILVELEQKATWQKFKQKLQPGGRLMANLGCFDRAQSALETMAEVFGSGSLQVKYIGEPALRNGAILALTGPYVSSADWQRLPADLAFCCEGWRTLRTVEDAR
ncbi:hypothetical protein WJX73_004450 [Symbiochloris irregularis]|uniref:Methyltransferase type 11 domain-containing protein n=1 Tax=Symbiochloris irregularis TaxID=706552 RepID=A0AAW1PIQ4_9CHLO